MQPWSYSSYLCYNCTIVIWLIQKQLSLKIGSWFWVYVLWWKTVEKLNSSILTIIFSHYRDKTTSASDVCVSCIQWDGIHLVPLLDRRRFSLLCDQKSRCSVINVTYLNFLDAVAQWGCSNTHQWVRLDTESPLFTLLLLCMADAAPSHNAVLQWASCNTHRLSDVTQSLPVPSPCTHQQAHVSGAVSTFMPKTFEERHIIQPQHLADVHVIWENG